MFHGTRQGDDGEMGLVWALTLEKRIKNSKILGPIGTAWHSGIISRREFTVKGFIQEGTQLGGGFIGFFVAVDVNVDCSRGLRLF